MLRNDYRYVLELYSEKGDPLGQADANVDFEPACEWTRLIAIRRGNLSAQEYDTPVSITPLWHSKLSEPYLEGFRVQLGPDSKNGTHCDFEFRYFKELAAKAAAHFVENGKLNSGDRF